MSKKLAIILLGIFLLLGCENIMNTPTAKVENFLNKYQMLDKNVLIDLDAIIEKDNTMSKKQKKIYKNLLEKQYQNLSYKIKGEEMEKETAIVEVEIEVLNYKSAISNSEKYYKKHPDEVDDFIDYELEKIKNMKDKTKYEITFYLTKEKGIWNIDELQTEDYEKINGLY